MVLRLAGVVNCDLRVILSSTIEELYCVLDCNLEEYLDCGSEEVTCNGLKVYPTSIQECVEVSAS